MSNDDILGAIGTVTYCLGFVALIALASRIGRRAREAIARGDGLYRIAPELQGEVTRDPSIEGPFISFLTDGIPTQCHQWLLFEGRTHVVTTFECRVRFPAFLQATSTRALRYPSRSPRFRELEETASFRIVTTDPLWAREILAAGLGQILRDLRAVRSTARIQLAVDRFLVEVESSIDPSEAAGFARLVARVAALGRSSDLSKGVTFVGDVSVALHGRCPVCGQTFEVAGVNCGQCRVPHHPDCWAYWGRCAIFGCRGRRLALPTSASP